MSDKQIAMQLQINPTGKGIEILAITAGIGNGWIFKPAVLQASVPIWDKAECYTDHMPDRHSVRDLGGILSNPQWDESAQGVRALLTPAGPASQVMRDLAEASLAHPALPIGMSADILMRVDKTLVLEIIKVNSLDVVMYPARGGKFVRVMQSILTGEPIMTPEEEKVAADKAAADKAAADKIAADKAAADKIAAGTGAQAKLSANQAALQSILGEQERQVKLQEQIGASDKLLAEQCKYLLSAALSASRLPEVTQARLRKSFDGTVFQPAQLQSSIDEARAEVSALTAAQSIQGPARINAMFSTRDQLQVAMDDLFGVPREKGQETVKVARLSGIREAYLMLTGDYDFHGGYDPLRAQFATTADFSGLVKNALNKVIVAAFDQMGRAGYDWWKNIVRIEHFNNLQIITGILVGTIASLPTIAEQGEYTEIAVGDNPETASFVKYGGYLPLTLEALDRDDTRKLAQYAVELGNAAMRNISEQIAYIFSQSLGIGPNMADGGALFNNVAVTTAGGHANLLTTALGTDYTAWNAVALAMFNQAMLVKQAASYYGTGKKLAVDPKFCLVPRALKAQAEALFMPRWQSEVPSVATLGGPTYGGKVVPVTVPEWTDATDWAAVADPNVAPSIILGERFGVLPEIVIAGNESDPAVFMNDEHRLKVRQFLAICVGDFRPLSKNNVAG
jgi:hypothetical protein